MKIFLCYGYRPETTGVYFERALCQEHEVYYVGPSYKNRPGYSPNEDIASLLEGASSLPQPDLVLFIEPGINFFPRRLEKMSCPTACYLVDCHQDVKVRERYAPFFDYLFIAQKDYVEHFHRLGYKNAFWLPLACDPEVHGKRNLPKTDDVGFVGNVQAQPVRRQMLEQIAAIHRVNDYSKTYPKEEIADVYSQSKIVFNCPVNGDLNMRVFEALASGSMLLTQSIANGQRDLFENRVHLVEYGDEREMLELLGYYLVHDDERERIAETGRQLVLAAHTYWHRCQTIIKTVFSNGGTLKTARVRTMPLADIHKTYSEAYAMLRLVDPALDEFALAWRDKAGRIGTAIRFIWAWVRRMNLILGITLIIRGAIRKVCR